MDRPLSDPSGAAGVPRLVVDPNVWVAAAITSRRGPADTLLSMAADADVVLLSSPLLLAELREVLHRPKFRRYLTTEEATAFTDAVRRLSHSLPDVDPTGRAPLCRDPDDEYLVALAQESGATFLVSGDKDVLAVEAAGLVVRTPRAAVDALDDRHAWGAALVPGTDGDAVRQAAQEGHDHVLTATAAFLLVLEREDVDQLLPAVVTPESLTAWRARLGEVRREVRGRAVTSRPDRPSESCAYVRLPPDPGRTIRATGQVLLPADTLVLTLQRRPELSSLPGAGDWRVHALGVPVLPEDLPAPG